MILGWFGSHILEILERWRTDKQTDRISTCRLDPSASGFLLEHVSFAWYMDAKKYPCAQQQPGGRGDCYKTWRAALLEICPQRVTFLYATHPGKGLISSSSSASETAWNFELGRRGMPRCDLRSVWQVRQVADLGQLIGGGGQKWNWQPWSLK